MSDTTTQWGVQSPDGYVVMPAADPVHAKELCASGGIREGWTVVSRTITWGDWLVSE